MSSPAVPATQRAQLPVGSLALYESVPEGSRAFVVARAVVDPDPESQLAKVFDPGFDPYSTVVVDRGPAVSGAEVARRATIREDTTTRVVVEASVPEGGGYLVLLDSFDPGWRVKVGGKEAELLRADGVFRAVRLDAGTHEVQFRYVPRGLVVGAAISLVSLALLAVAFSRRDPSST
jgi:hypothetical protein